MYNFDEFVSTLHREMSFNSEITEAHRRAAESQLTTDDLKTYFTAVIDSFHGMFTTNDDESTHALDENLRRCIGTCTYMSQKYSGEFINQALISGAMNLVHLRTLGLGQNSQAYPIDEQMDAISRDISALSMNINHMVECMATHDEYKDHEHTPEQVAGSLCLMATYCLVILYNINDGQIGPASFNPAELLN